MSVVVHIPGYLRTWTGGASRVALATAPRTVSDVLEDLWELHPGVRDRVVTEIGEVRPHVNIFVGNEAIRWTGGLDTPVPEDAEISIIPAVSGG